MDNMTALVSTFARAYHYKNNHIHIFADSLAGNMLSDEEYTAISQNMSQGISYFAPGFCGTQEEGLRFIVEHQLAPSVLARSAFCERAISNAVLLGCRQIVIFACGYDTFSLRTKDGKLRVFELDRPEMIADRQCRIREIGLEPGCRQVSIGCDLALTGWKDDLANAGFHAERQFFGSVLGISYYLSKDEFRNLLAEISSISCAGSSICFDYPQSADGTESRRNRELAAAAGEQMRAQYSCDDLENLLSEAGFLVYEHLNADEATNTFFQEYNFSNMEHSMTAPEGVGYCLAVKQAKGRQREQENDFGNR